MSPRPDALPGQEHFVAPADEVPLRAVDAVDTESEPRSLWGEAWHSLIRNPVFVISGVLIAFILLVTLFPSLFTSQRSEERRVGKECRDRWSPEKITTEGLESGGW